jgi:hypothetical protein
MKKSTKIPPLKEGWATINLPVELARRIGVCEALLVAQIHWLCHTKVNEREEYRWTYQTYAQWAEMLPFRETTIRHALTELESLGLVISGSFNKDPRNRTKWYRLDYTHHLLDSDICSVSKSDSYSIEIGQVNVSESDACILTENSPEISTESETPLMEIQKNKTGVKVVVKKATTSDAVLAKLQQANHNLPALPPNTGKSLKRIWQTVPKHNPDVKIIPVLTTKDQSALSYIAKHLGPTADKVVAHVVFRWIAYTKFVASAKGLKKTPNVPDIGFVQKYLTEAASFWKSEVQSVAQPAKIATPAKVHPAPVASPTKVAEVAQGEEEASLDDVLAWTPKPK